MLALSEIGVPLANEVSVKASGAVLDAKAQDGTLRLVSAADTGGQQAGEVLITAGATTYTLGVTVRTLRPKQVVTFVEANEESTDAAQTPVALEVSGLGADNSIGQSPLKFRAASGAELDQNASTAVATSTSDASGQRVSLKAYWSYDPAERSFDISGAALADLVAKLPPGSLQVHVGLVSPDGSFAENYSFLAVKPQARISGRLVTADSQPAAALAGARVLLRGYGNGLRRIATVSASGQFVFEALPAGTYEVTLADLANPSATSATVAIFTQTTEADVTLVLNAAQAAPKSQRPSSQAKPARVSVVQDGLPPQRQERSEKANTETTKAVVCGQAQPDGSMLFSAIAGAQGSAESCAIDFSVPAGTRAVQVSTQVSTDEYPVYTSAQSQYNDTWRLAVQGLTGTVIGASGQVNTTHQAQGSLTRRYCANVTQAAANSPLALSGVVAATNVGDSALATTVSVSIKLGCDAALRVTRATLGSPNAHGNPVLEPINLQGNLSGPYVSVPIGQASPTWQVPLEIRFEPANAQITEVRLAHVAGSQEAFAADNLLGQAHSIEPGRIRIPSLTLPAMPVGRVATRIGLTVQLAGTVDGQAAKSDTREGGQIAFGPTQSQAFVPLYLANDLAFLAGRRYGSRDAGGDSWATQGMLAWLSGNAYRFDDISAQHVAQTSTGRSVMEHAGHSDGQQADLRYADGAGGFSDALGGAQNGAAILALINEAAAEVASGAAARPRLAALQAWIRDNRAIIGAEANAAGVRIVYVGKDWLKLALIDGRFASGVPIPQVGAWTNKPDTVSIAKSHLNHWHVSRRAHP